MSVEPEPDTPDPDTGGLRLRGITKRFGSLVANDHIDLDIRPGEIHCLLGENGAGKSTLMNVLYGMLQPDEGEITIDGRPHTSRTPKEAMAAGIGMVHQHFMLVEVFSVAENLILGREQSTAGVLNMRQARKTVRELSDRYRLSVDPDALIEDLPVGIQQRVEILKALANDATYLIFDEPTAVLTPQEIDELITVMRSLRDEGKAIVFITHKLREVRAIADKITVIRRGKVVGTAQPSDSEGQLAELMVGRAVNLLVDKEASPPQRDPAAGAGRHLGRQHRRRAGGGRTRPGGVGRRDRLHRRGAGQRADRARRGPARTDPDQPGHGDPRRPPDHQAHPEAEHRRRPGLRARGPQARRLRRLVLGGGEPGPEPLRRAPVREGPGARPGRDPRATPRTGWPSSTSVRSRSTHR